MKPTSAQIDKEIQCDSFRQSQPQPPAQNREQNEAGTIGGESKHPQGPCENPNCHCKWIDEEKTPAQKPTISPEELAFLNHSSEASAVELLNRIQNYLSNGGLFNPELMEHDKVKELILDLRAYLVRTNPQFEITDKGIYEM